MKINQFESGDHIQQMMQTFVATPVNESPARPFGQDRMTPSEIMDESDESEVPEVGDYIRTKKMQMAGTVEKVEKGQTGYDEVYFRVADGRLMKAPISNVRVEQKGGQVQEGPGGGTLGAGINQWNTNNPVSYEHVLDEVLDKWNEEQGDECAVTQPPKQLTRSVPDNAPTITKVPNPNATYEERLAEFVDLDEAPATASFTDILGKQYADQQAAERQAAKKMPTKEIPYHGWKIRYRPAAKAGEKVQWQVMDKRNEIKGKGEALNDKEAVQAAEDYIKGGGGTKQIATGKVTIDFNVDFVKEFGNEFYATVSHDKGAPVLILSYDAQEGLKTAHPRTQRAGTIALPGISISPKDSNDAGLQPNGRYVLGPKEELGDGLAAFPLIFQSVVQGKGDVMQLHQAGLTVAHSRDTTVREGKAKPPKVNVGDDNDDFEDNLHDVLSNQPKSESEKERMLGMGYTLDNNGNYLSSNNQGPLKTVQDLQQSGKVMKKLAGTTKKDLFNLSSGKGLKTYATVISADDKHTQMWNNYILDDGRWIYCHWKDNGKQNGRWAAGTYEIWVEEPGKTLHEARLSGGT